MMEWGFGIHGRGVSLRAIDLGRSTDEEQGGADFGRWSPGVGASCMGLWRLVTCDEPLFFFSLPGEALGWSLGPLVIPRMGRLARSAVGYGGSIGDHLALLVAQRDEPLRDRWSPRPNKAAGWTASRIEKT